MFVDLLYVSEGINRTRHVEIAKVSRILLNKFLVHIKLGGSQLI
jgi:hypothetical protein